MKKIFLFLITLLPALAISQVEYDTVTVIDPEDFLLVSEVDTSQIQFFSKKAGTWRRVNPQTVKDWIKPDSLVFDADTLYLYSGGSATPLKVFLPDLNGIYSGNGTVPSGTYVEQLGPLRFDIDSFGSFAVGDFDELTTGALFSISNYAGNNGKVTIRSGSGAGFTDATVEVNGYNLPRKSATAEGLAPGQYVWIVDQSGNFVGEDSTGWINKDDVGRNGLFDAANDVDTIRVSNALLRSAFQIIGGANGMTVTSSRTGSNSTFSATNSSSGRGLYASSSSGVGIYGTGSFGVQGIGSSYGLYGGSNTGGVGVYAYSLGSLGAIFNSTYTDSTSAVETVRIERASNGTPQVGMGGGIDIRLASTVAISPATKLLSRWTDPVHATRTAQFEIQNVQNGVLGTKLAISGPGQLTLPGYAASALNSVDSSLYVLASDATGDVWSIPVDSLGGGGGASPVLKVENSTTDATSGTTDNYHRGGFGIGDFSSNTISAGLHLYASDLATIRLSDSCSTDTCAMAYVDFYRGWNTTNLGRFGFTNALDPHFYITNNLGGGRINFQTDGINKMSLYPTGQLSLPSYGDTTFTGTAVKYLGVTDDGLVIETDGSAGGATVPAVSSPSVSSTTAIDFSSEYFGMFKVDLSGVTSTTLSLSNPVNGGQYEIWFKGISTDTITFPFGVIDANEAQLLTRIATSNQIMKLRYDGANYITEDTVWSSYTAPFNFWDVDSLQYWYAADSLVLDSIGATIANGRGVGTWTDLAGTANLTQSDTTKDGRWCATCGPNSKPAVYLDGVNDFFASSGHWYGSDDLTFFIVMRVEDSTRNAFEAMFTKLEGTTGAQFQFYWNNDAVNVANDYNWRGVFHKTGSNSTNLQAIVAEGPTLQKSETWKVYAFKKNATTANSMSANGASISLTALTPAGTGDGTIFDDDVAGVCLGCRNPGSTPELLLNGYVSEVLLYTKDLTAGEINSVLTKLNTKYALY